MNKKEEYLEVVQKLLTIAKCEDNIHMITIVPTSNIADVGKFSDDNYVWIEKYMKEYYPKNAKEQITITIRKFEKSPNNTPYKTVASLIYKNGYWITTTEEFIKKSYMIDNKTKQPIKLEKGILFSTIPEMFPDLLPKENTYSILEFI